MIEKSFYSERPIKTPNLYIKRVYGTLYDVFWGNGWASGARYKKTPEGWQYRSGFRIPAVLMTELENATTKQHSE